MNRHHKAFTLVEILIVVVILGIVAGIALPQMSDVTNVARETNLKENLSKIRVHLQVYRNEHNMFPDPAHLGEQLTKFSDFQGNTAGARDTQHIYGPYIEQMPPNPMTKLATIREAASATESRPPGDVDGGWWYNPVTGMFFADLTPGYVDASGIPYSTF
jgi:general secretion pathway protein G